MSATTNAIDPNGDVIENCFQIGNDPRATPEPKPMVSAQAPVPPVPVAAPQPKPQPIPVAKAETVDLRHVLRQLKDRLRVVDREIKSRKTLEKERDQIRRLISATKNERDNLRRLRSAG